MAVFCFVMSCCARCLQCACANGVFYPNTLLIGLRGCSGVTVGVDGAVGTVCLAGLAGVVGGNFGGVVLFVGVGWLALLLWFGLFLLSVSWSDVGSVYLISTLCSVMNDPRKHQVLQLDVLRVFPRF